MSTNPSTTAYVGQHADETINGDLIARARDDFARDRKDTGRPESYIGRHRVKCDSCVDTGLVDWAPFQHRDSEEDQQPCPDCVARVPRHSGQVTA